MSATGIHHVISMGRAESNVSEIPQQVDRRSLQQASPLRIKTQPGDGLDGFSTADSASPGCPDAQPQSPGMQRGGSDEQIDLSRVSGTSSAASGSGFSRSQHFNPDQDAILRLECLSGRRLKVGWLSGGRVSCSLVCMARNNMLCVTIGQTPQCPLHQLVRRD